MARGNSGTVWRRLDGLFRAGTTLGLDEPALLDRFAARRDPSAFEAILARHGPMVWGVCARTLRDPNDAEDAFQATFLILAARAGSIRQREKLGGWLHGVAVKVARRARRDMARKRPVSLDDVAECGHSVDDSESRERVALLHEELARLPKKYRDPIVLCHLEGCTHDEAALRLGWPVGTVRGRLARGRDRLRERLSRRGLAAPLVGVDGLSSFTVLPPALHDRTVSAAMHFAAGHKALGLLSAQGAALVSWGLRAMFLKKLSAVLVTLAGLLLVTGVAVRGAKLVDTGQEKGSAAAPSSEGKAEAQPDAAPGADGPSARDAPTASPKIAEAAKVEQEIAEAEARIKALKGRIQYGLSQLVTEESNFSLAKRRLDRNAYDSPEYSDNQVAVKASDEMTLKAFPDRIKQMRAESVADRVEVARLEKRLAALKNPVADPTSKFDEATAQEETQIEILTIEAEQAKTLWQQDLEQAHRLEDELLERQRLEDQMERSLSPEGQKKHEMAREAAQVRSREHVDVLRQRAQKHRIEYIKTRSELARLQARVGSAPRSKNPGAGLPSNLDQRLSRIEQSLQRLEKAIDKDAPTNPRGNPFRNPR